MPGVNVKHVRSEEHREDVHGSVVIGYGSYFAFRRPWVRNFAGTPAFLTKVFIVSSVPPDRC
jgi:hypothetical protein